MPGIGAKLVETMKKIRSRNTQSIIGAISSLGDFLSLAAIRVIPLGPLGSAIFDYLLFYGRSPCHPKGATHRVAGER
jgi:hypothetical protein